MYLWRYTENHKSLIGTKASGFTALFVNATGSRPLSKINEKGKKKEWMVSSIADSALNHLDGFPGWIYGQKLLFPNTKGDIDYYNQSSSSFEEADSYW